jgi:hypothetical protein
MAKFNGAFNSDSARGGRVDDGLAAARGNDETLWPTARNQPKPISLHGIANRDIGPKKMSKTCLDCRPVPRLTSKRELNGRFEAASPASAYQLPLTAWKAAGSVSVIPLARETIIAHPGCMGDLEVTDLVALEDGRAAPG